MHEIKLVFDNSIKTSTTKLLHLTDVFNYPMELLVPGNCIGLKVYEGDMISGELLHDLYFDIEDNGIDIINPKINVIKTQDGKIVGRID